MNRSIIGLVAFALALGLGLPGAALGAFPGTNGEIAFVDDGDVWVVRDNGTGFHRVTTSARPDRQPEWSPDGRTILFTREVVPFGDALGNHEIYRIGRDGTGLARIGPGLDADYSPDGTRIVFTLFEANPEDEDWPDPRNEDVYIADADGTDVVRVTSQYWYTAAPDWSVSDDIAYEIDFSAEANSLLRTTPLGVAGNFGLGSSLFYPEGPSWSPDGTRLAVGLDKGIGCVGSQANCDPGLFGLAVMNSSGGDRTVLVPDGTDPAWSPDGTKIAFVSRRSGQDEIYVMNADGSDQRRVTFGGGSQPDWQPVPVVPPPPPPPPPPGPPPPVGLGLVIAGPGPTAPTTTGTTTTRPPPVVPRRATLTGPGRVRRGTSATLTARFTTPLRGATVRLQRKTGGRWIDVARRAVAGSVARFAVRPARAGAVTYRLRYPVTTSRTGTRTATLRVVAPPPAPVRPVAPARPAPTPAPAPAPSGPACDPNYSGACVPVVSYDLDCGDIPATGFRSIGSDPHRFDGDGDGVACES